MKLIYTLLLIWASTLLTGQAGFLDDSFGDNGKVITDFENSTARATTIAIQSDDKILLAGSDFSGSGGHDVVVVRYLPNGQIDFDYGVEGVFTSDNSNLVVYDSVIDKEDNLYILCTLDKIDIKSKAVIMKLNLNGVFDTSFGQNGIWMSELSDVDEYYRSIALQENGQLLITGTHNNFPEPFKGTTRRLNPDGAIDTTFGIDGSVAVTVTGGYNATFIALNSKEEIFAGGFSVNLMNLDSSKMFIVKYSNNGLLDTSFGVDGIFESQTGLNEEATSLYIQTDDRLILGTRNAIGSRIDFGLVQLTKNGVVDESFGTNGRVTTDISYLDGATSVLLQEDGKILLSGRVKVNSDFDYAIARYDSFGNLDNSFGENGIVITDFGFEDFINAAVLQTDGKLICAGSSGDDLNPISFSMARYTTEAISNTEDVNKQFKHISIFPNPSRGVINLDINLVSTTELSISLLNADGKFVKNVLHQETFTIGVNRLNLNLGNDIVAGLYNLKFETISDSIIKTVVIQ